MKQCTLKNIANRPIPLSGTKRIVQARDTVETAITPGIRTQIQNKFFEVIESKPKKKAKVVESLKTSTINTDEGASPEMKDHGNRRRD